MNKQKGKRGGRSSRGNGRGGGGSRQQSKQQQAAPEPVMDTTAATPPPPSDGGEYAQQIDEDGKQVGKYKTKLCVFHASPQGCPYGSECLFAHGTDELRPDLSGRKAPSSSVQQNPLYKTKLCVHWSTSGGKFCPHSTRCVFAHGMHELRAIGARPDGADGGASGAAPAEAPHSSAEAAAKAARRALTMAGRSGSGPPPLHSGEASAQPSVAHGGTPPASAGGTPSAMSVPSPAGSTDHSYSSESPPGGAPTQGMYAPPLSHGGTPPANAAQLASLQYLMAHAAPGGMSMQAQMQFMQHMSGQMARFAPHMAQQQAPPHGGGYPMQSGYAPQAGNWAAPAHGAAAMRSRCLKFLGEISELQGGVAAIRLGALRKEDPPLFAAVQETAARLGQQLPTLSPVEPSADRDSPPQMDAFSTHLGGGHSAPAGLHGGTPLSLSSLGEGGGALGTASAYSTSAAAPWGSTNGNVWGEPPSSTPPPQEPQGVSNGFGASAFGDASAGAFGADAFGMGNGPWSAPSIAPPASSQPSSALGAGWDETYLGAGAFDTGSSQPAGVWGN